MTIRRREFLTLAGAALGGMAAARAQRRQCRRLRSRTLRQCAHPAHDRHPCAVAAGVFSRAQRQSRDRRDGRQAAASGRPRLSRPLWHQARQRRRLRLHLPRFRKIRRALRQARRLRASENADRPPAQRCRARPFAAARRRRSVAGQRSRQCHAGRRHGRGRQPARHRGDDRPLGIHLWREGAAQQSRALQGRVSGAKRLSHRGSRVQRRQGVRSGVGTGVQAGHDQGDRRQPRRRDRAGLPLCADRASEALYAGLDVRHPRRRVAEAGQYAAQQRQGRCGGAVVA